LEETKNHEESKIEDDSGGGSNMKHGQLSEIDKDPLFIGERLRK
jgi:hypothetical protein